MAEIAMTPCVCAAGCPGTVWVHVKTRSRYPIADSECVVCGGGLVISGYDKCAPEGAATVNETMRRSEAVLRELAIKWERKYGPQAQVPKWYGELYGRA